MKKTVKLNEASLRRIVGNVLKEAMDGGWEVPDGMAQEAYELAIQHFGKEDIDDQIVQSLGNEQLAECLAFIFRMNDFREWGEYMEGNENGGERLDEGMYGYPDTVDNIILCSENNRECYEISQQLVKTLMKKARRGVELSAEHLSNSSWMKKFQQFCFRKFKQYQEDYDRSASPKIFRDWWAEKIIEDVKTEMEYERRNSGQDE